MADTYIDTTKPPPGLRQTTQVLPPAVLSRIAGIFYSTLFDVPHPTQQVRELDAVMGSQPIDEDTAHKLIQAIAAAQYSAISSYEYETVRLQQIFTRYQPMTELDEKLLQVSVASIHVQSDVSLQIRLKNNQIIERG